MLLCGLQVDTIFSSPLSRAKETAQSIADLQSLAGFSSPPVSATDDLNNRDWRSLEGRDASEVRPLQGVLSHESCSCLLLAAALIYWSVPNAILNIDTLA